MDIEVWDQDQGKDDDFMGRARVPIHSLAERGSTDMWITLEDASSGQVISFILHCNRMSYLTLG